MARIEVSLSELRTAFNYLRKRAPDAENSKCCCLFALYAVECGVSAVLLRERKEKSTILLNRLQPKPKNHDINALLKLCKNPPTDRLPAKINLARDRSVPCYSVSHIDLHSALRYGAKIPDSEWKKCATALTNISKWIITNLERR